MSEVAIHFGLEEQFLGQVMVDPSSIPEYMIPKIKPQYFLNPRHRAIFEVIKQAWPRKMTMLEVIEELSNQNRLDIVGGAEYIRDLGQNVITSQDGDELLRMFEARAARHTANMLATDIENLAKLHGANPVVLAEKVRDRYAGFIAELNGSAGKYMTAEQVHDGFLADRAHCKNPLGFPTGIPELDRLAGGLMRGSLNVLGGLPASGKTCVMLSIMRRQVLKHNIKAGFISLEMDRDDIAGRNLMAESNTSFKDVFQNGDKDSRVKAAARRLSQKSTDAVFAFDLLFVEDIYLTVWEWHLKLGTQIVYIDHLQQLEAKRKCPSYWERVAYITDLLKRCAKETGVVLFVASQFTRAASQPDSAVNEGAYGYVKGGTRIEEVADRVMYLVPAKKCSDRADEVKCRIVIVKNRHGRKGSTDIILDYKHQQVVTSTDPHFIIPTSQPAVDTDEPPF